MEYVKRFLNHPSKLSSHYPPQRATSQPWTQRFRKRHVARPPPSTEERWAVPSTPNTRGGERHQSHRRKRKGRHPRRKMSGPWSRDLANLKKSLSSVPENHKSAFTSVSNDTIDVFCDSEALHIWETDSDIDSMLQLTSVLAKLCDLGVRASKDMSKGIKGGMVIITEEDKSRDHFGRLCKLVDHLTGETGSKHIEGTICSYANASIVVVRGWSNQASTSNSSNHDVARVVRRVTIALQRALSASRTRKIVWHHGAVVSPLLSLINTTTPSLRNDLVGISVTGSLHLATCVKPSTAGRSNTLPDLERLQSYAKKLSIPVLFLDSSTQSVTSSYLATYMYFFAYYVFTFLPSSLTRAHLHAAQDELVTFAFRLRGASKKRYGADVVAIVKNHLDPRSKTWARLCIDPHSYEKEKCQAAGKESEVHHAVQLADSPFALFKAMHGAGCDGVAAFARLAVGPASPVAAAKEIFMATPVDISFSTSRLRARHPSNFYILLPKPDVTEENITNHIQGLMMGVLERVRQEHGNPTFNSNEKQMWKDVVKASSWALRGCDGKMPDDISKKVKFVQDKLTKGTWGYVVGAPRSETNAVLVDDGSGAASANAAAHAAVAGTSTGAGLQNAYAQVYGQQQMPMANGYAGHGQQGMMKLPVSSLESYPQQPQPYAPTHQQIAQLAMNPAAYQQGNVNGYVQGHVNGYGHSVPPSLGYDQAQQMPGRYPATPQEEYAQVRGRC
ncbi:hypothetical protein SVAN01_03834 [Stagonosporopsis vannaccii]|nr:hypothetical protein SVAN01_03834 [Stagonosporopsis vannaccii]